MAWTSYQLALSVLMVITGSINTLTTTWADHLSSKGSDGTVHPFDHPFVQACCMFLGEMLCLFVFKAIFAYQKSKGPEAIENNGLTRGDQSFNPFLFFPAAMCDMVGTSMMYVGLTLTNASSFQMLRGSVIVFVALLSMFFLRRKLGVQSWIGIVFVILGLVVVGLSDFLLNKDSKSDTSSGKMIIGDIIIVAAQVVTASQMVYEEKYVSTRDIPPLQAVGWEGTWGLLVLGILQIPFYYIHASIAENPRHVIEDFPDAMVQAFNEKFLTISLIGTIISIAFFNFAGISVTKELSATTRMILDSVRTIFIWGFSLLFSWQKFHYLQPVGFVLLVIGMCVYNNIIPSFDCLNRRRNDDLIETEEESS